MVGPRLVPRRDLFFPARIQAEGPPKPAPVASAIRFIAKAVMTGVSEEFFRNEDMDKVRGNLTSDKGLGRELIVRFLAGVPGINDGTVSALRGPGRGFFYSIRISGVWTRELLALCASGLYAT